jgi:hypothetical protein
MVLAFKGVAHPPPRRDGSRSNQADMSAAEIATTQLGRNGGTALLVEHDHANRVGRVTSSWEGRDGSLKVSGVVTDADAERAVRSGDMRGLSLGTSVMQTGSGQRLMIMQDELSICEEPRRMGCWIDEVDGRSVRTVNRASARGGRSRYSINPLRAGRGKPIFAAMSESAPAPDAAGEATFSKEYVDQLKREIAAKTESEALLKAKFASHEQRQRAQLTEMQPVVQAWIKEGMESAGDFKHEMGPMAGFGDNLHNAENLESALPLARMITVHSAKLKRVREEFSQTKDSAEMLGKANKELEEVRADRDSKATRISELEALCSEKQAAAEKLQEELARAGVIKEKFDFSKASSRVAGASDSASGGAAAASVAAAPQPFVDPLFAYVAKAGQGAGRIAQSATQHHILGAGGAGEASLQSALRMA